MARFGILGRLVLILVGALLTLSAASLLLLRWQAMHTVHPAPFLRIRQFAADVDLMAASPAATWPAELRALGGQPLHLSLREGAPSLDGLREAPRLGAKLHALSLTSAGRGTHVFTSASEGRRDPRDGVEGFMALAYAALPDGRFLVARPVLAPAQHGGELFGLPAGLWIGLCGGAVAILAAWGAAHEVGPLRALTRSLEAFDGREPAPSPRPRGAPDVRALILTVNAMQERVVALMRERTLMIGTVSHDLRTLLTRLRLRTLTLPQDEVRGRLDGDLDAMEALVHDALAYARGTEVALERAPLDLADLVAVELAEREAAGVPGPPVETHLSNAAVRGDAMALRRVVANFLDNAARFGRASVKVAVGVEDGRATLTVEDDGPGVPPGERAAVLLPFHRLEGSRSRGDGGVGLGLAIASRIAQAHGGEVVIGASELGGACARLQLPARAV